MKNSILILLAVISVGIIILFAFTRSDLKKMKSQDEIKNENMLIEYDKCKYMRGIGDIKIDSTTISDIMKSGKYEVIEEYEKLKSIHGVKLNILDDELSFDLNFFNDTLYKITVIYGSICIQDAFDKKYMDGEKYNSIKHSESNNLIGSKFWSLENKRIKAHTGITYREITKNKRVYSDVSIDNLIIERKDQTKITAYKDSINEMKINDQRKIDSIKLTLY